MSFSRPIQWYHSRVDPIWTDGTYTVRTNKKADLRLFQRQSGALFAIGVPWQECCRRTSLSFVRRESSTATGRFCKSKGLW